MWMSPSKEFKLWFLLALIMAPVLGQTPAHGQSRGVEAVQPSFEVASVKPSGGDGRIYQINGSDPGQISWKNFSLTELLKRAYGVKAYQIAGPGWLSSQGYDIMAKLPSGISPDRLPLLLQSLLKQRFKLACHFETRELPVLGLVVAKGGPKFKESPPATPEDLEPPTADKLGPRPHPGADGYPVLAPGRHTGMAVMGNGMGRASFKRETILQLVDWLTFETGHPVIDMTSLKGQYDFILYWVSENPNLPPKDIASEPGPNIYAALQQQAGLKLEQRTAPIQALVIDHVEKVPTSN